MYSSYLEEKKFSFWCFCSIICFICSIIMCYFGYDKMTNYCSGEHYPYETINAYVGGDAYNYIINGTYATAFFVLAAMFFIGAVCFIVVHYSYKRYRIASKSIQLDKENHDLLASKNK